jgi:RimJ/RimL family protein N-acetyltransferase
MTERAMPSTPIRLNGDGLVLRAFVDADATAIAEAFTDPDIARWNSGPEYPDPLAAALAWLRVRADWSAGDHASWAISDTSDALLGSVSLFHVSTEQLDGEVGYWVAPAARGRRLAARAVDTVAGFAFRTVGLHRLVLFHAVDNAASCRVALRAGFRLEGTLRQSHRYGDGAFHDEHVHGRLVGDPPAAAAATMAPDH